MRDERPAPTPFGQGRPIGAGEGRPVGLPGPGSRPHRPRPHRHGGGGIAARLRRQGRGWLPVGLVLASLVALAALPTVVYREVEEPRVTLSNVIAPARTQVHRLQLAIARQTAAARGALLSRDRRYWATFREAREEEQAAPAALDAYLG